MQRRIAPLLLHSDDRPADASVAAGRQTRTVCKLLHRIGYPSVSSIWKEAFIEASRQPEGSAYRGSGSPIRNGAFLEAARRSRPNLADLNAKSPTGRERS
jgi:hypothetical protein